MVIKLEKQFSAMVLGSHDNWWGTQSFRHSIVSKIEEEVQSSGLQLARNSSEMENHLFVKAKSLEEYMVMVAKVILHVRELSNK